MAKEKTETSSSKKLINNGPKDESNGAEVYRLRRKGNKNDLVIVTGQILNVGDDISTEEAEQLKKSNRWDFKEVNK